MSGWKGELGQRIIEDEMFWRWMEKMGFGGQVMPGRPYLYGEGRQGFLMEPDLRAVLGYWQEWLQDQGQLAYRPVRLVGNQQELVLISGM